jgi:hypothetical protein
MIQDRNLNRLIVLIHQFRLVVANIFFVASRNIIRFFKNVLKNDDLRKTYTPTTSLLLQATTPYFILLILRFFSYIRRLLQIIVQQDSYFVKLPLRENIMTYCCLVDFCRSTTFWLIRSILYNIFLIIFMIWVCLRNNK